MDPSVQQPVIPALRVDHWTSEPKQDYKLLAARKNRLTTGRNIQWKYYEDELPGITDKRHLEQRRQSIR